jgi:hypothetical protein
MIIALGAGGRSVWPLISLLLTAAPYVSLNPVRAGLVGYAADLRLDRL